VGVEQCEAARDQVARGLVARDHQQLEEAVEFAGAEGIVPAPESAHAIHGAIGAARQADEAGEQKTILFNLSGHGHFDMAAYDNFFAGKLEDVALDEGEIERALKAIEGLPQPA